MTRKTTVREAVLNQLASHPSQNAKEIHKIISRETPKPPTYQAVHKVLAQLERNGDARREKNKYSLSLGYVARLERHLADAKHKGLEGRTSFLDVLPGQSVTIEFNDTIAAPYYWFLNEMHELYQKKGPSARMVFTMNGLWPVSVLGEREYKILAEITRHSKTSIQCVQLDYDKRWNKLFEGLWRQLGVKITYTRHQVVPLNIDQVVAYDYIIQFEQEASVLDDFYKFSRLILPARVLGAFYHYVFNHRGKIKIHVTRNQTLADQNYQRKN